MVYYDLKKRSKPIRQKVKNISDLDVVIRYENGSILYYAVLINKLPHPIEVLCPSCKILYPNECIGKYIGTTKDRSGLQHRIAHYPNKYQTRSKINRVCRFNSVYTDGNIIPNVPRLSPNTIITSYEMLQNVLSNVSSIEMKNNNSIEVKNNNRVIEQLANLTNMKAVKRFVTHEQRDSSLQKKFAAGLYILYERRCAICRFDKTLIAAHIIDFADKENEYTANDINNGLLLCALHDKLFELNLMYIDGDGIIHVNENNLDKNSNTYKSMVFTYDNKKIFISPKHPFHPKEYLLKRNLMIGNNLCGNKKLLTC